MRAVRLVTQHRYPHLPRPRRRPHGIVQRAVIVRPRHQHRPRPGAARERLQIALVARVADPRGRERGPGEPHIQPRNRAQANDARMGVSGHNHLPAAARGVEQHRLNPGSGPAGEHQRPRRAGALRRQRLGAGDGPAGRIEVIGHSQLGRLQPVGVDAAIWPPSLRPRHMQRQPSRRRREHPVHGPFHPFRPLRNPLPAQMHTA